MSNKALTMTLLVNAGIALNETYPAIILLLALMIANKVANYIF